MILKRSKRVGGCLIAQVFILFIESATYTWQKENASDVGSIMKLYLIYIYFGDMITWSLFSASAKGAPAFAFESWKFLTHMGFSPHLPTLCSGLHAADAYLKFSSLNFVFLHSYPMTAILLSFSKISFSEQFRLWKITRFNYKHEG